MTAYFLVFSNAVEGREDEYNDWYDNVHLREVVAVDGILSAQRFKLTDAQAGEIPAHRYLAIYEVDGSRVKAVIQNLLAAPGNMQMSDAIDLKTAKLAVYSAITPVVR
jgi:hypothetical protein